MQMTEHSCENCIFHRKPFWYIDGCCEYDYCESQHTRIKSDVDAENKCLRFIPKTTTVAESEYLKPAEKIYIKELKPEDDAREVEFALVEVFNDRFEFERQVEKKLNDGWKPIGGVCYESGNYLMGMMRLGNKAGA